MIWKHPLVKCIAFLLLLLVAVTASAEERKMTLSEISELPMLERGMCVFGEGSEAVQAPCVKLDHGDAFVIVILAPHRGNLVPMLAKRVSKKNPEEQENVWANPIFFPEA